MNAMNLPGFTAEASLCTNHKSYKEIDGFGKLSKDQAVIPQMRIICTNSGGGWHCGVEDDVRGMSYMLF